MLSHHATSHFKKKLSDSFANEYNQCFLCSKIYSNETQLLVHLATGHDVLSADLPDQKSAQFGGIERPTFEEKTKVNKNKFKCGICRRWFSKKGPFKIHRMSCRKKFEIKNVKTEESGSDKKQVIFRF